MRNYNVNLTCEIDENDYYIKRACSSVDLNVNNKLNHNVMIKADFETDFNVGLIIGLSGSGKTTFAKQVFGNLFDNEIKNNEPIIKQFNKEIDYDKRVEFLCSIGMSTIPEWIKPFGVLSNGEKNRAEIAIRLSKDNIIGIDEFTSVLDRNVAKILSFSISKFTRKYNKKIILCSVHEDITEWLNPCWIVDMNEKKFIDRRLLRQKYNRKEKLEFYIAECGRKSWENFKKYHYLNDNLPGGKIFTYGMYLKSNRKQIGFQCFANYVPGKTKILHSNRTVIHPEYCGIGLGITLINETAEYLNKIGYDIRAKYSNNATYKSMLKCKEWIFEKKSNNMNLCQYRPGVKMRNKTGQRKSVTTYNFKYNSIS